MKNKIGRTLMLGGLVLLTLLFSYQAFSADLSIVDARRNIPLSDTDPVYKDFYINAGASEGLKRNMVVTVTRKMSIRDASGTQVFGDLEVPVGQIKIIALADRVAVAREHKLTSRDGEAMLEQMGLMIGDRLSMEGSFVDNKKASAK
jgi:hypothetical protein